MERRVVAQRAKGTTHPIINNEGPTTARVAGPSDVIGSTCGLIGSERDAQAAHNRKGFERIDEGVPSLDVGIAKGEGTVEDGTAKQVQSKLRIRITLIRANEDDSKSRTSIRSDRSSWGSELCYDVPVNLKYSCIAFSEYVFNSWLNAKGEIAECERSVELCPYSYEEAKEVLCVVAEVGHERELRFSTVSRERKREGGQKREGRCFTHGNGV